MATNPYSSQSASGYNSSPPPDAGEETEANKVYWATIKTKLADVLKTFVEAVDSAVLSAFGSVVVITDDNANQMGGSLAFADSELTISSGAITATRSHHTVDTESDAASDDLDTIATGSVNDGAILVVAAENASRVVTLTHEAGGAGQLHLAEGLSYALDDADKTITLMRRGADWYELSRQYRGSDLAPLVPLERITDTTVASYDFTTGIDSTYRTYVLMGWVQPATDDVALYLRTDSGAAGTGDSGATDYKFFAAGGVSTTGQDQSSGGAAQIIIGGGTGSTQAVGNAADEHYTITIWVEDPSVAAFRTVVRWIGSGIGAASVPAFLTGGGYRDATHAVDSLHLLFESGNIAAGDVTLYGVRNAVFP